MRSDLLGVFVIAVIAGCGRPPDPPADTGAALDALDAGSDDNTTPVDAGVRPPWPHRLAPASAMGEPRGLHAARVIVHSHSVHSHDACDGMPYVDGGVNEPCLSHFRAGLCEAAIDVDFLTEHATLMGDGSFERTMQVRPGDEPLMSGTSLIGYRVPCPDGHRALVLPGAENYLMPIALVRHPDPVNGSVHDAYAATDVAGVARFRAAGALLAIPHTEQKPLDELRVLQPDLIEVYNIHANLDPRIAGPYLGIDVGAFLADLGRFASSSSRLEPDLTFMAFFRENQNDLGKWAALWLEGVNMPGVSGTDVHENTFPSIMTDGERGDSYRRLFRWFSNVVLLDGPVDRDRTLAAISAGRSYVAFEAFGTPVGFDSLARTSTGAIVEMGGSVMLSDGPALVVQRPAVYALDPMLPAPTIRLRILRATATPDWTEVASGTGASLEYSPTQAGVYRAEARITPEHTRPYLPGLGRLITEVPWVYGTPIRVR